MQRILGVLGGMGPMATVDFMTKLIAATPAVRDQDHIPVLSASIPQIPDRSDAITGDGPCPEAAMTGVLTRLERGGALAIAIPCNTAHYWHAQLQRRTALPVFHIADAAIDAIGDARSSLRVGVMATTGTIDAGIYADRLAMAGVSMVDLPAATQETLVMTGIRAVKAGDMDTGARLLAEAADGLLSRGADRLILACTEIPPAMAHAGRHGPVYVDATQALAERCVAWALDRETDRPALAA